MWGEAGPSTIAALAGRGRARTGRRLDRRDHRPPEHQGLTAAQATVMGFELVRGWPMSG